MGAQVIAFVVIGHYRRRAQAKALAAALGAHLVMDEHGQGATWGHRRALEWAAQQPARVVVLEDDALPVPGFPALAEQVLQRFPNDLVSLYLGTGRPPQYQSDIQARLAIADSIGADHIRLPELIHGVCYSLPVGHVDRVLARPWSRQPDFAIGRAWCAAARPVIYSVPSLVDHADGPPVEQHPDGQPRIERRRAWRLPGVDRCDMVR